MEWSSERAPRPGLRRLRDLKEYEILGGILFAFLAEAADGIPEPCEKSELLYCGQRLFQAVTIIQQTTTTLFCGSANEGSRARREAPRFQSTVSHEIKTASGHTRRRRSVLEMPDLDPRNTKSFSR